MELSNIKGVGPKTLEELNKLNIYTINDLIRYYPYRYNIYTPSDIREAGEDTIVISGVITSAPKVSFIRRNFNRLGFTFETNNISIKVVIFNRGYLLKLLNVGKNITLIGKYDRLKNTFIASNIKLYPITRSEVEPVYHMVDGLKSSTLTKCIEAALSTNIDIAEIVPTYISDQFGLIGTKDAIVEIHNPTNPDKLKQAKLKLKYEELFEFMFKINILKYKNQIFDDYIIKQVTDEMKYEVINYIPFKLTNDQLNAIDEIIKDFNGFNRMNRLVLGDVGSGKTIVSFAAILINNKCGYQSALLAPTEVLAKQHYENFKKTFKDLDINVELLVGSLKKKEKEDIKEKLRNGEVDLLIGTHAILEDDIEFSNLGLVVTDEQHRFGVNQRKSLQNKGVCVDVLYMSATPIPRTYALTIYGDMDISLIKEKPAGRKDIITKAYTFKDEDIFMNEINEELENGHQVYAVAPLIEGDEESELNDINKIEEIFNNHIASKYKIGILHGKMKPNAKNEIMDDFKSGKLDILISTTVIEVGVDVKNATMMIIFNAERFGLATLHQLRGRVGRNELQSKCLLISDKETERLNVLCESNDGFYISEKDFEIRGSGDLFGTRQSGDMVFKIADIKRDIKILLQCKKDVEEFIANNIENGFRDYLYYNELLTKLMNNN